jgi:hypothetical protein
MPRIVAPSSHFLYPQTRLGVENDPDRLLSRVGGRMIRMGVMPGFDRGAVAINARQTVTLGRFKAARTSAAAASRAGSFSSPCFNMFPLPRLLVEQSKAAGGFRGGFSRRSAALWRIRPSRQ